MVPSEKFTGKRVIREISTNIPPNHKKPKNPLTGLIGAIKENNLNAVQRLYNSYPLLFSSNASIKRISLEVLKNFEPKMFEFLVQRLENKSFFLVSALNEGNRDVVLFLLDNFLYLHNFLYEEIKKGNKKIAEKIKRLGICFDDSSGRGFLHLAAIDKNLWVVNYLFLNFSCLNYRDNDSNLPAYYAIANGCKDCVEILCGEIERDGEVVGQSGTTALHVAADYGRVEIAEVLIEKGHRVDLQNEEGFTPLHIAIEKNQLAVFRLLLAKGARIDIENCNGESALELVIENINIQMMEEILWLYGEKTLPVDSFGITPTSWAIRSDFLEGLELLKSEEKVDLSADVDGWTPIDYALSPKVSREEYFSLIWSEGVPLTKINYDGTTYMHMIVKRGYTGLLESFLKIHKNSQNQMNYLSDRELGIKSRVRVEDRISVCDKSGNTLFHEAARCGKMEIVKILYEYDQNFLTAKNHEGKAAVDLMKRDIFAEFRSWLSPISMQ